MYWHDAWDWLWMTFAMTAWVIVLGLVVYVAIRLSDRGRGNGS